MRPFKGYQLAEWVSKRAAQPPEWADRLAHTPKKLPDCPANPGRAGTRTVMSAWCSSKLSSMRARCGRTRVAAWRRASFCVACPGAGVTSTSGTGTSRERAAGPAARKRLIFGGQAQCGWNGPQLRVACPKLSSRLFFQRILWPRNTAERQEPQTGGASTEGFRVDEMEGRTFTRLGPSESAQVGKALVQSARGRIK